MTETTSLHDLLLLIQKGNTYAYEDLYNRVCPKLSKYVLRKYGSTLDESDAQDVVHSAMLKVWQHASQYQGINADGWLYKIASSEAGRMVAVRKKYLHFPDRDNDENDSSAVDERNSAMSDLDWEGEDSVEERAFRVSALSDVEKYVDKLRPEDLHLLKLRYTDGCTYEDIAKSIKRTRTRAKQKHDDIIAKIRSLLGLD